MSEEKDDMNYEKAYEDLYDAEREKVLQLDQENKELRTRVADAEEEVRAYRRSTAGEYEDRIKELQNRLSTLEKNLADVQLTCRMEHDRSDRLQSKLSTLLKASEGMEKALEEINEEAVSEWDWLSACENIANISKQALAEWKKVSKENG